MALTDFSKSFFTSDPTTGSEAEDIYASEKVNSALASKVTEKNPTPAAQKAVPPEDYKTIVESESVKQYCYVKNTTTNAFINAVNKSFPPNTKLGNHTADHDLVMIDSNMQELKKSSTADEWNSYDDDYVTNYLENIEKLGANLDHELRRAIRQQKCAITIANNNGNTTSFVKILAYGAKILADIATLIMCAAVDLVDNVFQSALTQMGASDSMTEKLAAVVAEQAMTYGATELGLAYATRGGSHFRRGRRQICLKTAIQNYVIPSSLSHPNYKPTAQNTVTSFNTIYGQWLFHRLDDEDKDKRLRVLTTNYISPSTNSDFDSLLKTDDDSGGYAEAVSEAFSPRKQDVRKLANIQYPVLNF